MSISVRISDELYNSIKKTAKAEYRSISNQLEFLATIGQCALDNPDLPIEFIRDLLVAKNEDPSLLEPFIPHDKQR